ncbi:MAG TPA: hypothetical protein VG839_03465 [Asticcacaulis sp.]|nr:hypothetical protein [Asticcacaulis sp.]
MNCRILFAVASLGVFFVLADCSPMPRVECAPDKDSWTREPGYLLGDYADADQSIRDKLFSEIRPEKLATALARVQSASDGYVEISPDEAKALAATVPAGSDDLKPFLVRALSAHEDSGHYTVDYFRNQLWVRYDISDYSVCKPSSFREALVIWLPQPPSKVAITIAFQKK